MNQEEVLEMGAEDEYTEEQEARDARLPSVLHAYAKALKLERATVIDSDLIPCIERASELLTTLQAAHDKLEEKLTASNKLGKKGWGKYDKLKEKHDLFVEALSEIKATVDGDSKQPVKDIIYGCLAELTPEEMEEV